jgi:hypothetical protein
MMIFSAKWITWVQSFISSGSVIINVNDNAGNNKGIQTRRSIISVII